MIKLSTVRGETISKGILDVVSSPNVMKVRNQLLDGSFHIQTLGNPYETLAIKLDMTKQGKKVLDDAYIYDTELEFLDGKKFTRGLLQEAPNVTSIVLSKQIELYSVDLVLVASQVGWYD